MRIHGRTAPDKITGVRQWITVETDKGYNDYVYITALLQCLKLNLGESPFYGNYGIPARASVLTQVAPDYAVAFTQAYFSQFFASLLISKTTDAYPPTPNYNISLIRNDGSPFQTPIAL